MRTLHNVIKCILILTILFVGSVTVSYAQSPKLADQYKNQAKVALKNNQYQEAAQLFEKSAEAEKNSPNPRLADLSYELAWAGFCYETTGQHDKALKNYEETLAINRKLGAEGNIARDLNNIGMVYKSWGQYDKALKYYEESLAIDRKLGKEDQIAIRLNNIGVVYKSWEQYDKALKYYEEALAIDRKLRKEDQIAIRLNNIGMVYKSWSKYDKAIQYFEESLAIARKLGKDDYISIFLNNIGLVYDSTSQYDKALKNYEESLAIDRKLGKEDQIAIRLNNIGVVYYNLKKHKNAIENFSASVDLYEKLRKTATGTARRDYLASQIGTYQYLISSYQLDNDLPNAFKTMEISRAKLLAERLAGRGTLPGIPSVKSLQQEMSADAAIIAFANSNWNPIVLLITKENITSAELDKKKFMESLQEDYIQAIKQLLANQRGLKVVIKSDELDKKPQDKAATSFDDLINYYRSLLTNPSSGINRSGRGLAVRSKPGATAAGENLDRMLYDFLIKPVAQHIKDKKRVIIIPDGVLSYLPFETLKDENSSYLVEKYAISYTQSMGIMEMLKRRSYSADRKSILAFGGAIYEEVSYTADMITNEKQLLALAKDVNDTTRSKRALGDAYASLGLAKWDNLPGTLSEVGAIAKTVKGAKIVTGRDVTESGVKQLSESGELAKYKVVHFATHGIVVPELPELSAIVLSQVKNQPDGEDGYLRMNKIEQLKLKADFVNLSACETGLGKIYGGEGVVGLTQSFLLAGANGLSASLWSVNDVSTSQFMVALYNMVEHKKIGYGDAITEIKRSFIKGKFGESYKSPYYWAPFVYYGKL